MGINYKKTKQIKPVDEVSFTFSFLHHIKVHIGAMGLNTIDFENGFSFKRPIYRSTHQRENMEEAIIVFREGQVYLRKNEDKTINVDFRVKLDMLLFLSTLLGGMFGLISKLIFQPSLMVLGLVILIFILIAFAVGFAILSKKIKDLIDESCDFGLRQSNN